MNKAFMAPMAPLYVREAGKQSQSPTIIAHPVTDECGIPTATSRREEISSTLPQDDSAMVTITAPDGSTASGNGTKSLDYTAKEGDCGQVKAFTGTAGGVSGEKTAKFNVVQMKFDHEMWWFNGENAKNYYEVVTLTAGTFESKQTGPFQWSITAGTDKVEFIVDGQSAGSSTTTDKPSVAVKAIGASGQPSDITFELQWSGQTFTLNAVVYSPTAKVTKGPTDFPWPPYVNKGYMSSYEFEITDQFGRKVPNPIEINEQVTSFTVDWSGSDWPHGEQPGFMTKSPDQAKFVDNQQVSAFNLTPTPVVPTDTNAGAKIHNFILIWRAGSTKNGSGVEIIRKKVQRYRGKARYE